MLGVTRRLYLYKFIVSLARMLLDDAIIKWLTFRIQKLELFELTDFFNKTENWHPWGTNLRLKKKIAGMLGSKYVKT